MTGSALKAEIRTQMTDAMKAGEKVRLGALRMFVSAIRYKEDELGHELSDEEIGDVATKEVKKRSESIEAFEGAGRTELAEKETPGAPDHRGLRARPGSPRTPSTPWCDEALAATGATSVKELGKVMGFVMGKAKGAVDGTVVQEKVRAQLSE